MFRFAVVIVSLLTLGASTALSQQVSLPSGGNLLYSNGDAATKIVLQDKTGKAQTLRLQRDSNVAAKESPIAFNIVGEVANSALVLVDKYRSLPGGLGMCKSGEESFLRIVAITRKPPIESLRVKLESCIDNIELASPGIEWLPASSTLHIRWLSGPSLTQQPEELIVRVGPK